MKQAPVGSDVKQAWVIDDPCGPSRQRPLVPEASALRKIGQLSRNPRYRRLPPYCTKRDSEGRAAICCGMASEQEEAQLYGQSHMDDACVCFAQRHLHSCRKTCWKHAGGGSEGDEVRVCRFNFFHEHELVYYPRRWPRSIKCRNAACHYQHGKDGKPTEMADPHQDGRFVRIHPERCPADVPVGVIRKRLRRGKALVLPKVARRHPETGEPLEYDYRPQACLQDSYGRAGRPMVLRYHPLCGSSNPVCQVCMRCNFDVQCTDRVFVLLRKRLYTAAVSGGSSEGTEPRASDNEQDHELEACDVCQDCVQHVRAAVAGIHGGGFDGDADDGYDEHDGDVDYFPGVGEGEPE